MALLKYIIPLLLPLFLTSCYEDFIPEIDAKPVLCINSLITAGEKISVNVSHTWLYTSMNADKSVKDATVSIFVNDLPVDEDYLPQEGDRILIRVESPTYGEAHAEVMVPDAPEIELLETEPVLREMWREENSQYKLKAGINFNLSSQLKINDMPGTDNFYRLSYSTLQPQPSSLGNDDILAYPHPIEAYLETGYLETDTEPIFAEHISVFETVMGGGSYGFTFFTDRQFAGKSYTLNLLWTDCVYGIHTDKPDPKLYDCGILITLHSISRSYYDWANCQWQMYDSIFNDLGEIGFADPLWAYSNVSTGAGVVAAQSATTLRLPLTTFISTSLSQ